MKSYKEEWWSYDEPNGYHCCGAFNTLEDAIEDGIKQYKVALSGYATDLFDDIEDIEDAENTFFYVGKRVDFVPCVNAEYVIDDIVEQAYEFFDEWYCEDYNHVKSEHLHELQEELQKVYDAWEKKYNYRPSNFMIEESVKVCVQDYLSDEETVKND